MKLNYEIMTLMCGLKHEMLNDEKYLWYVSLSFFPLNDGKLSFNSHKSRRKLYSAIKHE